MLLIREIYDRPKRIISAQAELSPLFSDVCARTAKDQGTATGVAQFSPSHTDHKTHRLQSPFFAQFVSITFISKGQSSIAEVKYKAGSNTMEGP